MRAEMPPRYEPYLNDWLHEREAHRDQQ
jgi:hypothetical protein